MAVAGEGESVLSYTENWFAIVNRGLFPLNDNSFTLFIEIEKCVRYYLPKHVLSSTADKQNFQENVHSKAVDNDTIQFYWTLLSQEIDNPDHAHELLEEIVKLWVTVRGFSLTATWMEAYKQKEKKTIQNRLAYVKVLVALKIDFYLIYLRLRLGKGVSFMVLSLQFSLFRLQLPRIGSKANDFCTRSAAALCTH